MEKLRDYLNKHENGHVKEPRKVEQLLATHWDEFDGDPGAMSPEKLIGRTEDLTWTSPILTFSIERHGATVMGSSRAEIHSWELNLETGVRSFYVSGQRVVRAIAPRLNVKPIAEEIARFIDDRAEDERLKWQEDGRVRVRIGKIIPLNGLTNKQTVAGRRKRFWTHLDELLAENWTRNRIEYQPRKS
ncbi:MAG: hypothetical protein KDA54_07920 [Phycisphaerales bacterium]|nr:hypothetical protein [Phycisphaerales bacterium]